MCLVKGIDSYPKTYRNLIKYVKLEENDMSKFTFGKDYARCFQILILIIVGKKLLIIIVMEKAYTSESCVNFKNSLHSFLVTTSTYFIPITYTFPCSC